MALLPGTACIGALDPVNQHGHQQQPDADLGARNDRSQGHGQMQADKWADSGPENEPDYQSTLSPTLPLTPFNALASRLVL